MRGDYLRFDWISKHFPGVQALDTVSLSVGEGCVRALLGENGAGKSTLLKILSGALIPDAGAVFLNNRKQSFHSTADALQAGIAVIYQELNLVPGMTVAENLFLGHLPNRFGWLDKKRLREAARRQLALLGEDISPSAEVGSLPLAQRQMIEIAKALTHNAKVIAFDEPTSSLSDREVRRLFSVILELRHRGHVIIYVSHRLQEVFEVCDSATVLRDGKVIETFPDLSNVDGETLVQRMVGRSVIMQREAPPKLMGDPALEVEGLMGVGFRESVSFSIAKGEIVGLFGLIGAGRTELAKLIYGATKATAGKLRVWGKETRVRGPDSAIRCGIVFCPEDRKKEGLIPIRSVSENINISVRRSLARFRFFIDFKREYENASMYVEQLQIKTPSLNQLVRNLSGGNQQKVILARWLSADLRVILLDEPTRGIDVGSKSEIHAITRQLARNGIGVLFISSELPEILNIAHRILVMRQGRIVASLDRAEATEGRILTLALPSPQSTSVGNSHDK